jgi:hypothetical protein
MKNIFVVIIILYSQLIHSQYCKSTSTYVPVSNECNPELLNLPVLKYDTKGKSKIVFEGLMKDLSEYDALDKNHKSLYAFTKIKKSNLTGAIAFVMNSDSIKHYFFPMNNKVFNNKYFNKNIQPLINESNNGKNKKVFLKIYCSAYKNPIKKINHPTIVIDSVKRID